MTLQQLHYILALDAHRHFGRAAEACHVTQATLSMMVQKLEQELGCRLFDRSRQPIVPTDLGARIVAQAREVVRQAERLQELAADERQGLQGELHLGIIPTLAPYLLPALLGALGAAYPGLRLHMAEHTTAVLIDKLRTGTLDMALLSTPLAEAGLRQEALFDEPFRLYAAPAEQGTPLPAHPKQLDPAKLWLLEEGHCMRDQVLAFCQLARRQPANERPVYQAGSIETLRQLVDQLGGYTVVPALAVATFGPEAEARVHPFAAPAPSRQISLVCAESYPRERLLLAVANTARQVGLGKLRVES